VLAPAGDLDIATSPTLLADGCVRMAVEPFLVVDLRQVRFADVVAVETFLRLHHLGRRLGGAVAFAGAGPSVRQVIALTGLDAVLDLYDCVGCALFAHRAKRGGR
jgi:anti-sigma B factor antagonist